MTKVRQWGLNFVVPPGWLDITDDLPQGGPPTLAKPDGVGVVQFSVALYKSGVSPNIDVHILKKMLANFGDANGLGTPRQTSEGRGHILLVSGDFLSTRERIAAWYVSNGKDVAFITYITQVPSTPAVDSELRDAAALVASLDFD